MPSIEIADAVPVPLSTPLATAPELSRTLVRCGKPEPEKRTGCSTGLQVPISTRKHVFGARGRWVKQGQFEQRLKNGVT